MAQKTKTSPQIKLLDVRLAFPQLLVPKLFGEDSSPRFEATFLLDPSREDHALKIKELKAAIKALAVEAYGDDIPADILSGEKVALKNNAFKDDSGNIQQRKKYDGYANMYVLSTSAPAEVLDKTAKPKKAKAIYVAGTTTVDYYPGQPPVVNRARVAVKEGQPEMPYGGCYVNAIVSFWAQPKGGRWGARINANLVATQFNRDGDPFGRGSVDVESAFEAIGDAASSAGAAPSFLD